MRCFEIKNQIINLDHVSSITYDVENFRIIFNLDYCVEIDVDSGKSPALPVIPYL